MGKLVFDGVYVNGELKHGKEYKNEELIFEGEYIDMKKRKEIEKQNEERRYKSYFFVL